MFSTSAGSPFPIACSGSKLDSRGLRFGCSALGPGVMPPPGWGVGVSAWLMEWFPPVCACSHGEDSWWQTPGVPVPKGSSRCPT
eukprot:10172918-Heterocapsa_arctica.AAC.1